MTTTSDQKVFKFGFIATLQTLKLNLKFPCVISIIWKRGEKLAEVAERKYIVEGVATFNQDLSIDCNMIYDVAKKQFEAKKVRYVVTYTIFSILIFSEKGTKQAGEVYVDVSELLNKKMYTATYTTLLQKCPDKTANLTFKLRGIIKEYIKMDMISQSSFKTVDVQKVAGTVNTTTANFKKKKYVYYVGVMPYVAVENQPAFKIHKYSNGSDMKLQILEEQNRKLREELKEAKKENEKIKKSLYDSKKQIEEWKWKSENVRQELYKMKEAHRVFKILDNYNKGLESYVLSCRLKLASIFNAAFEIGGPQLADELQYASGYIYKLK